MRWKLSSFILVLLTIAIVLPEAHAMQMAAAPVPSDWAYITGTVTYDGKPQDGVSVAIPGGNSYTTKDGGYYKIYAYPRISVTVTASYKGASMTRNVEVGGEGSLTEYNFSLTSVPVTGSPTPTAPPAPQTTAMTGTVKCDGNPVRGALVTIPGVSSVRTDSYGQYMAVVPAGQNMTVSVMTDAGTVSRTVISPVNGTSFEVDLEAFSPTATPQATATPLAPTTQPATPTPAPAGSELLVVLTLVGLVAAIGLLVNKK